MSAQVRAALDEFIVSQETIEHPLPVDSQSGLFGILTRPSANVRDTGFIFLNSGLLHRVGPFRLYVDIARSIAKAGFPSIRLDQSGKGDSEPMSGVATSEITKTNLRAAADCLRLETGVRHYVVGGLCSGADDALQAGPHLDGLRGLFMLDGYVPKTARYYVQRYGPKIVSARSWLKRLTWGSRDRGMVGTNIGSLRNWGTQREMIERFRGLVDKDVYIFAFYSGWYGNNFVYPSQLITSIDHTRARNYVTELHIPDATHLLHLSEHRQFVVTGILEWADTAFPNTSRN